VISQRRVEDKGQRVPLSLGLRHAMADRLVFTKWREGSAAVALFRFGGAPLSPTLSYSRGN
jgi:hypothetical protein